MQLSSQQPGTPPDDLILAPYDGVRFVVRPDLFDATAHYLNMDKNV